MSGGWGQPQLVGLVILSVPFLLLSVRKKCQATIAGKLYLLGQRQQKDALSARVIPASVTKEERGHETHRETEHGVKGGGGGATFPREIKGRERE